MVLLMCTRLAMISTASRRPSTPGSIVTSSLNRRRELGILLGGQFNPAISGHRNGGPFWRVVETELVLSHALSWWRIRIAFRTRAAWPAFGRADDAAVGGTRRDGSCVAEKLAQSSTGRFDVSSVDARS